MNRYRILIVAVGFAAAAALHMSRCNLVRVPGAAVAAPTGTTGSSGPTGLTSLPPGVPVAPGAITSTGQPLRIGEAFANTFDPTTGGGLARPLGSLVYLRNASNAWIKTGAAATAWSTMAAISAGGGLGNLTSDRIVGRDTAGVGAFEQLTVSGGLEFTGSGGIQRSALTGDVTATAGSGSTTIANDAVTNAKLANMANATIKCRTTSGTGDPEDCTAGQVNTILGTATPALVLVTSQDVSASPITWSGLTGDASTTLGYKIYFRVRAGGAGTTVALRINNSSTTIYDWARTDNDGTTVSAASAAGATSAALHVGSIGNDERMEGEITIPVSAQNSSFASGNLGHFSTEKVTGNQLFFSTGSVRYENAGTQLTRLDILATAGSFEAGTRAALYRITR